MCAEENSSRHAGAAERLETLERSLSDCRKCGLCDGRTQVVFGTGSAEARLMFVGEGPGFHEDRQGEPFVGQAGRLLNDLLAGVGLARADVYIANVVKCRPPDNRDPTTEEIGACSPHLHQQIEIIRPTVICTLGRFATRLLTGSESSITAIHGKAKEAELGGVSVMLFPVFHPAAALYTPSNRQVLEEDFAKLRVLLDKGSGALVGGVSADRSEGASEASAPAAPSVESSPSLAPVAPSLQSSPSSKPAETTSVGEAEGTEQLPLW